MVAVVPTSVETVADLPNYCGRCGRAMKFARYPSAYDHKTGRPLTTITQAICPKWAREPLSHEAFTVNPRP